MLTFKNYNSKRQLKSSKERLEQEGEGHKKEKKKKSKDDKK